MRATVNQRQGNKGAGSVTTLTDRIATRLTALRRELADVDAWDYLSHTHRLLDERLRIAVLGPTGRGRTTLINALMGRYALPAGDGTACPTWVCGGFPERVRTDGRDGVLSTVFAEREDAALRQQLRDLSGGLPHPRQIRLELAQHALTFVSYLDTPALDLPEASSTGVAQRGTAASDDVQAYLLVLSPQDLDGANARATVTMLRRLAAGEPSLSSATCAVVLGHADGAGGSSAGSVVPNGTGPATELVRRWVESLGEPVFDAAAVVSTWAQAARCGVLDDAVLVDLRSLARDPRRVDLTESADTFVRLPAEVPGYHREYLLAHLGISGVRVALALVDEGCTEASSLRQELERVSGFPAVRNLVSTLESRSDLLRADSMILRLGRYPHNLPDTRSIHDAAEELRLDPELHRLDGLAALHVLAQGPSVPSNLATEIRRLTLSDSLAERLGMPDGVPAEVLVAAAADGVARWQAFARRRPRVHPEQERLALAMTRSYTHMRRHVMGSYL
jgi:hypothetical protein